MRRTLAAGLLVALLAGPAAAAEEPKPGQANALRYDLRFDVPFLALGFATMWLTNRHNDDLASVHCAWCDRDSHGRDTLNGLDRGVRDALRWNDTDLANRLSDWSYYSAPLVAAGAYAAAKKRSEWFHFSKHRFLEDALFVAQAMVWAKNVSRLFKYTARRERPWVHVLPEEEKLLLLHPRDANTSFYSGHSSAAFALAVSSGTIASLRGYRSRRWIWIGGLTLATATGYFRIAADKHYFTDVMTGAVMGSLIGYSLPRFLHPVRKDDPTAPAAAPPPALSFAPMPAPGGLAFSLRWTR